VYEVMRTEAAVTGADGVPVGFAALGLVYAGLAAVAFVMLRRLGRQPFHAS
jgi:cytochrome d ubiquinol oxidase subunit I